jgi:mannitol-specific phosphotransferase system IIBC component
MKTAWGVACTTILFTMWLITQYKEGEFRVVKTNLYLPIFGFIVWSFITLFWVEDGYSASVMLAQFVSYALIFFIIINVFEKKSVMSIVRALVAVMSVVSFVGLLQYYFSDIHIVKNLFSLL